MDVFKREMVSKVVCLRCILGVAFLCFALTFVFPAAQTELSLARAIELSLSTTGDARIRLVHELEEEAKAQADRARSELLPNVSGYASYQQQTRNLEAFGFEPDPRIAFFRSFVGPFATVDLRAGLTQSLLDLSAIKQYQASRSAVKAAAEEGLWTADQVAAETARLYVNVLRTRKNLETSLAAVKLAQALLDLALNRKSAGAGTAIEVTRAQVQLSNERQVQLAADSTNRQAMLRLLRLLGLSYDQPVRLTGSLGYPSPSYDLIDREVDVAFQKRNDLRVQQERVRMAELALAASRWRRAPSLVGFADYGTIGTDTGTKLPTWTAGLSLRIPVFDGGLMEAVRSEKASNLRREKVKLSDLEREIELQVRLAHEATGLAGGEVGVAEEGVRLANQEMSQAKRRYTAGVTTGLEVTDAQTRLRRADNNLTAALVRFNLARIELWYAMGTVREKSLP